MNEEPPEVPKQPEPEVAPKFKPQGRDVAPCTERGICPTFWTFANGKPSGP